MRYGATILLSAFLLFQVQPLVAKAILPWFGGSPSVWTTCMLFFQVVLVGGYAYAHILSSRVGPRRQALIHTALLVLGLAMLPILPDASWKPSGSEDPTLRILLLLTLSIGLPYFLLSSTGPLVQRWFTAASGGKSPYRLYALSNIGSVAALVSFPFLFEPVLTATALDWTWSTLFAVFALLCIATAWHTLARAPKESRAKRAAPSGPLPRRQLAAWLSLAALPSVMLLATTNVLCQDVASVPFLWVAPLTVYLLTFILCFDSDRWYRRRLFAPLLAVTAIAAVGVAYMVESNVLSFVTGLPGMTAVYLALLFLAGMVCHGELAASRPEPARLTAFYLSVSVGGALGGIFVALIAPLIFNSYAEFWLGAVACAGVAGYSLWRAWSARILRWIAFPVLTACLFAAVTLHLTSSDGREIAASRSFFGRLGVREHTIYEQAGGELTKVAVRGLRHGRILHGMQIQDARRRGMPTTYFTHRSGIGIAMGFLREVIGAERPDPVRIGIIGLGAGTLAAYAQRGDQLRLYEIQPEVIEAANRYFTYVGDARERGAEIEVVLGDARIQLERERPNHFDLLVVDAFSSDAIPHHLLTRECADVYRKHLRENGLLAIHITNQHLDLLPIAKGLAKHLDASWVRFSNPPNRDGTIRHAVWVVITNNKVFLNAQGVRRATSVPAHEREALLWTDDFSSLWHVLK